MHHAPGYISLHIISMQSLSVSSSPCCLLLCVYHHRYLPPNSPHPPSLHSPSHHPGQPMWSEWRLIQGVRPCLKCNKLPLGWGTVHPSQHITRDSACTTILDLHFNHAPLTHTPSHKNTHAIACLHTLPLNRQPALVWLALSPVILCPSENH